MHAWLPHTHVHTQGVKQSVCLSVINFVSAAQKIARPEASGIMVGAKCNQTTKAILICF